MAMGNATRLADADVGDHDRLADGGESPVYRRLNQLLREHGFDDFAEAHCTTFCCNA
jgi:hypothetical protein